MATNIYNLDNEIINKAKDDYRCHLRDNDDKATTIFNKTNEFFKKESPQLRKFLENGGYLQAVTQTKNSKSEENINDNPYGLDKVTLGEAKNEYQSYIRDHDAENNSLSGIAKTKAIYKKMNAFFKNETPELKEFLERTGFIQPTPPQPSPISMISIPKADFQKIINVAQDLTNKIDFLEKIVKNILNQAI